MHRGRYVKLYIATLSGQSALPITAIIAVFGAELGSEPKNAHTLHLSRHDPRALKRRSV